ncbi:MAG: hypothetical protein ABIJ97_15260 [Bacteroidota bacterium]
MIKDVILIFVYTAIFIYLIIKLRFFYVLGVSRYVLPLLFLVKVVAGIALVYIYSHFYSDRSSSDIFKFFDDGNIIFGAIYNNPIDYLRMLTGIDANSEDLKHYYASINNWFKEFNYDLYNDNRTIIRINAFFRLFSFGSIHVHNIFMSFLAFTGLTGIFKTFNRYYPHKRLLLIIAIYLLPSVLLWTSGSLKEGIVIFSLGLMFYCIYRLIGKNKRVVNSIILILCLIILFYIKIYVLISIIPAMIFLIWFNFSKHKKFIFLKFLITHVVLFLIFYLSKFFFFDYDLLGILVNKQHDFINLVNSLRDVGSYIEIPKLENNLFSIFVNIPNALFNVICRPHFFDIHNLMVIPAFLENLVIWIFIILSFIFGSKNDLRINSGLMYFCASFSMILFIVTGLTTPVIGALVRYKVPALPFFVIMFIILFNNVKFKKFIIKYIPIYKK